MSLVLSIDTSTPTQCLGLIRKGKVLASYSEVRKQNHSTTLLAQINIMLSNHKLTVHDLDLIVVGLGPGSFTALRVGSANAKALSLGASVPIKGVSTIASMSFQLASMHPGKTIWAGVDARRDQIYAGGYQMSPQGLVCIAEDAAYSPDALAQILTTQSEQIYWVGHKTSHYEALEALAPAKVICMPPVYASINPISMALLGQAQFEQHGADDLPSLEPNYVRPSDAEQSLARRLEKAGLSVE